MRPLFYLLILIITIFHTTKARDVEYVVRNGDTLWKIAEVICRDPNKFTQILARNQALLRGNPNTIYPDQRIIVPCAV